MSYFDQFKDSTTRFAGQALDQLRGHLNTAVGMGMAAQEAGPALLGGLMHRDRTDTHVNPAINDALLQAHENAGGGTVKYEHYPNTAGGVAGKLVYGTVAPDEFKYTNGIPTGVGQKYDTDKTPLQALSETFVSPDLKPQFKPWKPAEALLAAVQGNGLTTHDVDFNKDIPKKVKDAPLPSTSESPINKATNLLSGYVGNITNALGTKAEAAVNSNPKLSALSDPISKLREGLSQTSTPSSYTVKSGDTLTDIAASTGVSVADLAAKNKIANANLINVGQTLNY